MNFNFELILTSIFIVSFTVWLANHLIFKHKEGPLEFIASLASVLGIVLILRSFVVEPFQIPSKSMVPTLQVGDFILVNKWTYGLRLPVLRHKFFEISYLFLIYHWSFTIFYCFYITFCNWYITFCNWYIIHISII